MTTPTARPALYLFTTLLTLSLPTPAPAATPDKPNILFILTDDQGYSDVGCYGSPNIRTPRLDQLAKDGLRLTDFYAANPLCTPSRAALLTGCYPARVSMGDFPVGPNQPGITSTRVLYPNSNLGLNPDEFTIPKLLKSAGYSTHIVGKWHLGDQKPFLPLRHGFDSFFGMPNVSDQKPLYYVRNDDRLDTPVDLNHTTQLYTREAIEVIKSNKDHPFFLYLAHSMPHWPVGSSEAFHGKNPAGPYADTIEEIDASTGQILDTLKELHLDQNTLVVFTSDNGPWLQKGLEGGNANPLRAGKGTTYEGGVRVPCILRWPNHIPQNSTSHAMLSMIDFLPTFASITHTTDKIPQDRPIDGKDISANLSNPAAPSPHEYLLYYGVENRLNAVRSGEWKLKFQTTLQEETHYIKIENPDTPIPEKLFNLTLDPAEQKSLLKDHPEIATRLRAYANTARPDLGDSRTHTVGKNVRPIGRLPTTQPTPN